MKKNRIQALSAFSIRLAIWLLAIWFLCMGITTYATARFFFDQLYHDGMQLATTMSEASPLNRLYYEEDDTIDAQSLPAAVEYGMLSLLSRTGSYSLSSLSHPNEEAFLSHFFHHTYEAGKTAALLLDSEGNIIHQSDDYLYFCYSLETNESANGYGWIDLHDEATEQFAFLRKEYIDDPSFHNLSAIRLTGYFEGTQFMPYAMSILNKDNYLAALEMNQSATVSDTKGNEEKANSAPAEEKTEMQADLSATSILADSKTTKKSELSELDEQGLLKWDVQFDYREQMASDKESITLYTSDFHVNFYQEDESVVYHGETYPNLLSLLHNFDYHDASYIDTMNATSMFNLDNMTIFSTASFTDYSSREDSIKIPSTTFLVVMQAHPLRLAMSFLRYIYILTALLTFLVYYRLRHSIKKHLIQPLSQVNQCIADGWTRLPFWPDHLPKWRELYELEESYLQTLDKLQTDKNEITRLTTALSYAKTAEQNRRQMTSNIAHELKTPLAVIHSYAEGLKEHIAEDKRDKYIEVILTESERMDQMVLEMLDLSRLEAGRVKLSNNDFSLTELTKAIFTKLTMAIQEKKLQIHFIFSKDCIITADEKRIAQVIENFATNAIKYTPAKGHVIVKIMQEHTGVTWTIENESVPLSKEALSKVWDTFYRTDESRSGNGTGLGLAIAKNIIELHNGKCFVQNTETGVLFGFTLYNHELS